MGFASTETLLPLDSWARIMQLNPWWFNQWGKGLPKPDSAQCPHVFYQFSWQQDFLSREEIAQSIHMAENMIAQQLHFYPAPKYILDENIVYPHRRGARGAGRTSLGAFTGVHLNWKKVQGGGVLARTEISASVAVNRSDTNNDTLPDLFTVAIATTVTDPNEIAIYYTETDRNNEPISEAWRIRPVNVTIAGGTATIKGSASMLGLPDKQLAYNANKLDVSQAGDYITNVAVYRVYRDDSYDTTANTSKQGYAMWENFGCDTPPCGAEYAPVCIGARDPELGFVAVDFSIGSECHAYAPDRLSISYLAGEPLVNGQMNRDLADAVAHLATALFPVEKCGCERVERILAYWRETGPAPGEGLRENLTGFGTTDNPFGPQRGARYAWNKIRELRKLA